MTLDRCRALIHGRAAFPFTSKLFHLFFERFPETRPTFDCRPPRPITEVQMHMWGQMMSKRGLSMSMAWISSKALALLVNEDDFVFVTLEFTYAEIDWRYFPDIFFTATEPSDDRGNISVFFKLI